MKKTKAGTAKRRFATTIAAFGVLIMSSGLALVVTATPAQAKNPVNICHATSSDTNPYVFITVDNDSAKLKGHLMHRSDPNKTWKSDGTFEGVAHKAGDAKPDLIGSFTDDQNVFHLYDGDITAASCDGAVAPSEATADVDFTDPSCLNDNTPSYDPTGNNVTFAITDGSVAAGQSVEITATANEGSVFADQSTTEVFTHTFGPAVNLDTDCVVSPPNGVSTASVSFTDPTCGNANAASYTPTGDNVTFAISSGSAAPGQDIEVTATATAGNAFAGDALTKVFTHHFSDAVNLAAEPCAITAPPTVTPGGTVTTPTVVTPAVVHAGLISSIASVDPRHNQGLALIGAGLALLIAAGGLVRTGGRARI